MSRLCFVLSAGTGVVRQESQHVNYGYGNAYSVYPPYSNPPFFYPPIVQKFKMTAGLLALFLGVFGAHNFYLRKTIRALTQFIFTTFGFFIMIFWAMAGAYIGFTFLAIMIFVVIPLWSFIEAILLFCGVIKTDGRGIPLI